jgi:hypothetical protein
MQQTCRDIIALNNSGVAFENALVWMVSRDNAFCKWGDAKQLHAGVANTPLLDTVRPTGVLQLRYIFNEQKVEFEAGVLYRPDKSNFPLVDAFTYVESASSNGGVATLLCFQFTFAKTHAPTASVLTSFVSHLNNNTHFHTTVNANKTKALQRRRNVLFRVDGNTMKLQFIEQDGKVELEHDLAIIMVYITRQDLTVQNMPTDATAQAKAVWAKVAQYRLNVMLQK